MCGQVERVRPWRLLPRSSPWSRETVNTPPSDQLVRTEGALRRLAMLVARGAETQDVFGAFTAEIGPVLTVPFVGVLRYDGGDAVISACGANVARRTRFKSVTEDRSTT